MTAAVTIHFRKPELTRACLESLLADGWDPVLVWDNSDDSGVSIQTLQAHFRSDSRVLWVPSPRNVGFGQGMNKALAELGARGYDGPVLLINNDARVIPGMREALMAALKESSGPSLIAPRMMQDGNEQGWLYYQPWLALVTRRPVPGSFPYLSGCCLLVDRIDNATPLFDEDFFMYGEDVDLCWRQRVQNNRVVLLDTCWIAHDGSASTGQASQAYEYFLPHSHWLLANKLAPDRISKRIMQLLRVPTLIARSLWRAIRFKSLMPIQMTISALKSHMRNQ